MSQDREPRYFDFIYQHEERLNLIYRRWEAQIEKQSAANRSQTLVAKIKSHKKTAIAGMAIAFGSVLLACQYGKQINARKTLIASNAQQLNQMTGDLQHRAAFHRHLPCHQDGNVYQLTSGSLNHHVFTKEPRSFISQPQTISVSRFNSTDVRQPIVYFRLNADRNLMFSSTEQTGDRLQTTARVIDLDRDLTDLPVRQEAIDDYVRVQEQAIALNKEFSQCLSNIDNLGVRPPFPQPFYAD